MIDKISGLGTPAALYAAEAARMRGSARAPSETAAPQSGGFSTALKGALDQVNQAQNQAEAMAREFQLGNPKVSLEEMMIAGQTANISFQTLVQTRNRLVNAYNEIMNMQV
ncbi:MAG: flagellar hook-basal body complex protein FliE [Burkholderiaceae bacterium]|nr:MAG: flagellar hook-basal body complex protein FliE [Burkholderiaceae bacterium]